MARKLSFKPSHRDTLRANDAAIKHLARMSGKPVPPEMLNNLPPKRERAAPRQLEAPVVAAISSLLAIHPKVLFAVRQNSGSASYEAASGKWAPVKFYYILTTQPVTITDFWGILRDGRMLAIEAKAPRFKGPRTDREFKQAAFLMMVRNAGGIAGFACSVDEAKALLDG